MCKLDKVNNEEIYEVKSSSIVIKDVQTSLDLLGELSNVDNCNAVIVSKDQISEEFFDLSSGIAGEILQKFIMYNMKIAIVGDFQMYSSKALKDFIYECNKQGRINFVQDKEEAIISLKRNF